MSEMPERIWAARYNQSQMWFSPALFGTTDTEYVRADIVAKKDAEIERLTLSRRNSEWICGCGWINGCNLSICAICSRNPQEGHAVLRTDIVAEKDAEIERLRKAMYPNWRKQAPYHRSDVPGHDASGVLALKCLSCMKFEPFYAMFRCFDCGSWLCRNCCMAHFGTAHLPHPAHLHEYQNHIAELDVEIERLKATIAASDERLQKAAERVRFDLDTLLSDLNRYPHLKAYGAAVIRAMSELTDALDEAHKTRAKARGEA